MPHVVLASASPARLQLLRRAGVVPSVIVSGVDESGIDADTTAELVCALARLKADAVYRELEPGDVVVIGCDSMLECDGRRWGKPGTAAAARKVWRLLRGRSGILYTGHHVIVDQGGRISTRTEAAATAVHFAELADAEIEAYVATGEPLHVAGAFTIDGYGSAYITHIDGDASNVIGLCVPLLREMVNDLGVPWHTLWMKHDQLNN